MRILFFIDGLIAGGKERRLVELMKGMKSNSDIDFELVVMNKEIHYKEVFDLGVKIHYLIRSNKKDISVFKKFYSICKNYRPDIVHCWDSMTAMYSIPACKMLGIKFVNGMIVDAPAKQNILNKTWFRAKLSFPFSNIIVGNSKAGLNAYSVPWKKSFFIYNGFNFDRIREVKPAEKVKQELNIQTGYTIGMVASFSEYKDYPTYFKAAQILLGQRDDICFLAIGTDTDSAAAKAFIEPRYEKHFRLLGRRSDVESLVNILDIGVLSTFTEGISNSILEYMAMAKPVIASEGGGTNEIIENGKTGFLVGQSDPEELAKKMDAVLNDAGLRKKLGEAGNERIKTKFSIHNMVSEYISLYRKIAAKKGAVEEKNTNVTGNKIPTASRSMG